jgi:hypothetical protein
MARAVQSGSLENVMRRRPCVELAPTVVGTRALAATPRSDTPRRRLKVSRKIAHISEDLEGPHP